MKKSTSIFLFTFLHVLASPEQVILRSANEGKGFTVPRRSLRYADTLYTVFNPPVVPKELNGEKVTEVSLKAIDEGSLSFVAALLHEVEKHEDEDLTEKQLLDFLENTDAIKLPSYEKKISLLKVADFLGFDLMRQLLARSLAKDVHKGRPKTILQALPTREDQQQVAKYYYLLYGRNVPKDIVSEDSYGFSVNELLVYRRLPGKLGNKRNVYDLSGKRITDLAGLEKIKNAHFAIGKLLLNGNKITTIPADVFKNFHNLEQLDLRDNHIDTLEPGAFNGLEQLHVLRLGKNRLEYISDDIFARLKNIFSIGLQDNTISEIAPEAFAHNKRLSTLDVSDNPKLNKIPVSVLRNTNLNVIRVGGTRISEQYERRMKEMFPEIAIDK